MNENCHQWLIFLIFNLLDLQSDQGLLPEVTIASQKPFILQENTDAVSVEKEIVLIFSCCIKLFPLNGVLLDKKELPSIETLKVDQWLFY